MRISGVALLAFALIAGCKPAVDEPPPVAQELSRDHIGYYCNMIVLDHQGPKGQVHLSGVVDPLWFTSIRDTLAFLQLPEEPKNIAAVFVSDMGRADWDRPQAGTWIEAGNALYVIGSDRVGGMGVAEAVPFSSRDDAERFTAAHGGRIVSFESLQAEGLPPVHETQNLHAKH